MMGIMPVCVCSWGGFCAVCVCIDAHAFHPSAKYSPINSTAHHIHTTPDTGVTRNPLCRELFMFSAHTHIDTGIHRAHIAKHDGEEGHAQCSKYTHPYKRRRTAHGSMEFL